MKNVTSPPVIPCPFCALQCGLTLQETASALRVVGAPSDPISGGHLCRKGLSTIEVLNHTRRIQNPMARINTEESLAPATWDGALDLVAERIKAIRQRWGADRIAVYGSGALSNETAYILGKFARLAIGTREIDYNGRFCMSAAAKAYTTMLGYDRPSGTFEEIRHAQVLLVVGSNLSDAHPMAMRAFQQAQSQGATLIVVDPRQTRLAKAADIHLAIRPGTDGYLAWALLNTTIGDNLINHDFIRSRTNGFDAVKLVAQQYSPENVAQITDIRPQQIRTVARIFAQSAHSLFLHARGLEQYHHGVQAVSAFLNLVLATGNIGRPGTGAIMLTGQANGQGGRELGQKSDQLPGTRPIDDPQHRAHIASVWGVHSEQIPQSGRFTAAEFFPAIERGDIRALIVVGANPLLSAPDSAGVLRALRKLDLLVVLDPIWTETAELAHVVLPAGGFGITEGTVTTVEARITPVPAAPRNLRPSLACQDWKIIKELANRLGKGYLFPYSHTRDIFDELRHATKGAKADYSGLDWDALFQGQHMHWPAPEGLWGGTQRLYTDTFAHPDGKAQFSTMQPGPSLESPSADYPLRLITGRQGPHYNSGAQTRYISGLSKTPTDVLIIHPQTAVQFGVENGQPVEVCNTRGTITLTARLSQDIRPDTVFASMHGPFNASVNHLVPSEPLGLSGMPEFKHVPVSVRPVVPTINLSLEREPSIASR